MTKKKIKKSSNQCSSEKDIFSFFYYDAGDPSVGIPYLEGTATITLDKYILPDDPETLMEFEKDLLKFFQKWSGDGKFYKKDFKEGHPPIY